MQLPKKACCVFFFLLFLGAGSAIAQIVTIGPMFHWNIGNKQSRFSYGLESALYGISKENSLLSADIGMEFERNAFRFYSEIQQMFLPVPVGFAAGPVFEKRKDEGLHMGFQCSAWIAYFAGADIRYRYVHATSYVAPGLFVKAPLTMPEINFGPSGF